MSKPGTIAQRLHARDIVVLYENAPCLLDHFWLGHLRQYPTVEALLSDNSMAIIRAHADMIEVDNIDVECGNANIKKCVARALQQRSKHLCDASSSWIFLNERGEDKSPWGEEWVLDSAGNADANGDHDDDDAARTKQSGGAVASAHS